MKKIILLCLSLVILTMAYAQTAGEWLQQKKTRLRYLTEQIAALKAYGAVAEKSYSVAHSELKLVSDIKRGDWMLHKNHIEALRTVSPAVRKFWKLGACETVASEIEKRIGRAKGVIRSSTVFTPDEKGSAEAVFNRMNKHKEELLQGLAGVITDGQAALADAERIDRIDTFYDLFLELKEAAEAYGSSLQVLSAQRQRELRDIGAAAKLHKQ